jgi:hypothetical protein
METYRKLKNFILKNSPGYEPPKQDGSYTT